MPARRIIDQRARPECPSCGSNDWDDLSTQVAGIIFPVINHDGSIRRDAGMQVVAYVCNYCGFLRAHSQSVLEALEAEQARNN
jgi:predicted RNA-binding Zn-ribbon protein involved in translation (DUF1610 family)